MKDDDSSTTKHYKVGYKKPPKSGQFKKGVSGNKKGRPKKKKESMTDKSTSEILQKVLNDRILISDGQGPKTITKGEAMITQLVNKAINGDMQAFKQLQPLIIESKLLLPYESKTLQNSTPVKKGLVIHHYHRDKEGNSAPIESATTDNEAGNESEG